MNRWRIFIASSKKGYRYAEAVKSVIDGKMGAPVCHLWDQGAFEMGTAFLETLEGIPQKYNCGLAVFTADDHLGSLMAPRDNVVLEFGLFVGAFGRERSFLLVEGRPDLKIPTDYSGITYGSFFAVGEKASLEDRRNAVHGACASVVDKLNGLEPPSQRPAALVRLEKNWRQRRPGSEFELFSFYGLSEAGPGSGHGCEEDVYYLWADAAAGSSIRARVLPGDTPITEVRYDNAPGGFPANIAVRPGGRDLVSAASGRFAALRFEARVPEGATTAVTFGVRVVDALVTHWEYCRLPHEYRLMTVSPGEPWKEFVIPLDDPSRWSVFASDGNALYHDDRPDFSRVLAVIFEVGSKSAGRPGAGSGVVQFKDLRPVEHETAKS
jgi:hypothetical protein